MADVDVFDLREQEKQRADAEAKAKLRQKTEIEDLKWLMSNRRGRRIVYGIVEQAGVFRLSFHTNALQMAFNEGGRNGGLNMVAKLNEHCPDLYALMLKEHSENE